MLAALSRPFTPGHTRTPSSPLPSKGRPDPSRRPTLRSAASLALLRAFAPPTPSTPSHPAPPQPSCSSALPPTTPQRHKRTISTTSNFSVRSVKSIKSTPTSPVLARSSDAQARAVFSTPVEGVSASASLKSLVNTPSRGRGRRRGSTSASKKRFLGHWSTSESDDDVPPVPPLPAHLSHPPLTAEGKQAAMQYDQVPSLAHSSRSSLSEEQVLTPVTGPEPGLPGSPTLGRGKSTSPSSRAATTTATTVVAPRTPVTPIKHKSSYPVPPTPSASASASTSTPPSSSRPRGQTGPLPRPHRLNPAWPEMDPYLASLEQKAKLLPSSRCSVCEKKGRGFPSCPRCGVEWCSRGCRTEDLSRRGLRRHECPKACEGGKGKGKGREVLGRVGLQRALVEVS